MIHGGVFQHNRPVADIRDYDQKDAMSANKAVGKTVFIVVASIWAYIALTGESRLPIGIANGSIQIVAAALRLLPME